MKKGLGWIQREVWSCKGPLSSVVTNRYKDSGLYTLHWPVFNTQKRSWSLGKVALFSQEKTQSRIQLRPVSHQHFWQLGQGWWDNQSLRIHLRAVAAFNSVPGYFLTSCIADPERGGVRSGQQHPQEKGTFRLENMKSSVLRARVGGRAFCVGAAVNAKVLRGRLNNLRARAFWGRSWWDWQTALRVRPRPLHNVVHYALKKNNFGFSGKGTRMKASKYSELLFRNSVLKNKFYWNWTECLLKTPHWLLWDLGLEW